MKKDYSECIGRKFGNLTIIEIFNEGGHKKCKSNCDCGNVHICRLSSVLRGGTKACGCLLKRIKIGDKYNKLTIIEKSTRVSRDGRNFWKCKCDCGKFTEIISSSIGSTKSCGCYAYEKRKENNFYTKYPGDINSYFWTRLKSSARLRGIEVSITPEYAWELFEKQNKKCALSGLDIIIIKNNFDSKYSLESNRASLDRIDSSKGYIEGNIQWVHKDINLMKMSLEQSYFIELCKKISDNN